MAAGRRAALLGAAAALGGCGFHPLYMPGANSADAQLSTIYVAVMSERPGQLLRQALQRRFDAAGGDGRPKLYELVGGLGIGAEGVLIQQDSTSTRIRYNGTATWALRKLDLAHTELTKGTARALDGVNINDQQYFAADMEGEAVQRRIAETCADQIALQVAAFLTKRAASTT